MYIQYNNIYVFKERNIGRKQLSSAFVQYDIIKPIYLKFKNDLKRHLKSTIGKGGVRRYQYQVGNNPANYNPANYADFQKVYDEFIKTGDLTITASEFADSHTYLQDYWNNNYSKNSRDTQPKKSGDKNYFNRETHLADTVINFWYKYKSATNINYNEYLRYIKHNLRNKCFTKLCDKKKDKQTSDYIEFYDRSMMMSPEIKYCKFYNNGTDKVKNFMENKTFNADEKIKEQIIQLEISSIPRDMIYNCERGSANIPSYENMIELLNELYCVVISYNIKNPKKVDEYIKSANKLFNRLYALQINDLQEMNCDNFDMAKKFGNKINEFGNKLYKMLPRKGGKSKVKKPTKPKVKKPTKPKVKKVTKPKVKKVTKPKVNK